jgi:transcriptional regulator with XRE-family HTH domain
MVKGEERLDLGDFVKLTMRRKGLTLRDVERNSGGKITDGYVSGIINGEAKNLTVEKLKALAAGLGVEADDLFKAACGSPNQLDQQAIAFDPSHSLMILSLMQRVAVSSELTEMLQEIVDLAPEDRQIMLRTLRTLNETRSSGERTRGMM